MGLTLYFQALVLDQGGPTGQLTNVTTFTIEAGTGDAEATAPTHGGQAHGPPRLATTSGPLPPHRHRHRRAPWADPKIWHMIQRGDLVLQDGELRLPDEH